MPCPVCCFTPPKILVKSSLHFKKKKKKHQYIWTSGKLGQFNLAAFIIT